MLDGVAATEPTTRRQRAAAAVCVTTKVDAAGRARLERLRQSGSGKLLLPRRRDGAVEAVIVNAAGGLAGGDSFDVACRAGGGRLVATTQAAERAYRAAPGDPDAAVSVTATVAPGATLFWAPQETILFDGCQLARRLDVDIALGGGFIAVEAVVLGRQAMGERVRTGRYRERWRVRHGGRLVFADETRLEPSGGESLDARFHRPAIGGESAVAFATLLTLGRCAPERDRDALRGAVAGVDAGVSLIEHGGARLIVARLLAPSAAHLRGAILKCFAALEDVEPPRVWRL